MWQIKTSHVAPTVNVIYVIISTCIENNSKKEEKKSKKILTLNAFWQKFSYCLGISSLNRVTFSNPLHLTFVY